MPRAVQPDLLLDRGDPGDVGRQPAALVAAARDLERDVGAEAVVERARDQPASGEAHRLGADNDRIADPQQLERLVAVGGADVDVQAGELDRHLLLLVLEQVDRLAADHPGDEAVAGLHLDPLADQDLRVPAADRQEPRVALLVDVGDRQPDLVDVADDRDQRPVAGAGHAGDRGADPVGLELRERGGVAPHLRRRRLVSRGRRGAQELVEKLWNVRHCRDTLTGTALRDDRSSHSVFGRKPISVYRRARRG